MKYRDDERAGKHFPHLFFYFFKVEKGKDQYLSIHCGNKPFV